MGAPELLQLGVYAARPSVSVDGVDDADLASRLIDFRADADAEGLAALQARFANWQGHDFVHRPGSRPRLGSRIRIRLGDALLFDGRVSAIGLELGQQLGPLFSVCAEDDLAALRRRRCTRLFEQRSLHDVFVQLVNEVGLIADPQGLDSRSRDWLQANESHLAFLRRLMREAGCTLLQAGERRIWAGPLPARAAPPLALVHGENLQQLQISADLAHLCTRSSVAGYDPVQGAPVEAQGVGLQLGLAGHGLRGDEALRQCFGERIEHVAAQAVHGQAQAQQLADAAFDERCRRFVSLRAVCEVLPAAQPGSSLELRGCGAWFDGLYQLLQCSHRFDAEQGLRTELQASSAYLAGGL